VVADGRGMLLTGSGSCPGTDNLDDSTVVGLGAGGVVGVAIVDAAVIGAGMVERRGSVGPVAFVGIAPAGV